MDGQIDLDELRAEIDDSVAFVTMMWANNETGVIFPAEDVAAVCKSKGVPFHCDAAQSVGKVPVDFRAVGFDCATLDAHKFHGPKGVGALYLRRGLRLPPLFAGSQERGRRGGTENVAGIVGMGRAAELAKAALPDMAGRVASMRDDFEQTSWRSSPTPA